MDPVSDFPALETGFQANSHMLCAETSQADFAQQMMKMGFMVTWLLADFLGAVYGDHQRLRKDLMVSLVLVGAWKGCSIPA